MTADTHDPDDEKVTATCGARVYRSRLERHEATCKACREDRGELSQAERDYYHTKPDWGKR